uniref:Vesicle transport protein n=1 Tax=Strix occidentalis caurina TaxID=311401 RepID=A0A8D0EMJ2_STROC
MDKLKRVLSGRDAEEPGGLAEVIDATSLGWGTRVKGFVACFAIGCLCSLLGSCLLWVPKKGLMLFAVFYTLGNIASIGSKYLPRRKAGMDLVSLYIPFLLLCSSDYLNNIVY